MTSENSPDLERQKQTQSKSLLRKLIMETDIYLVVSAPLIIVIVLVILWILLSRRVFPDGTPQSYNNIIIICCAFISGLSGFAQIIRREAPGPLGTNKTWAVMGGVFYIIFFGVWEYYYYFS